MAEVLWLLPSRMETPVSRKCNVSFLLKRCLLFLKAAVCLFVFLRLVFLARFAIVKKDGDRLHKIKAQLTVVSPSH